MLSQSYTFSHGLCLNNLLQVWLIDNQRDQVPLFRYINQGDDVSHLVRGNNVLVDIKYLMRSVKRAADTVRIWTEEDWDVKSVIPLYTMVSGRLVFKINKRFDSLSWSSFVRDLYTRRVILLEN